MLPESGVPDGWDVAARGQGAVCSGFGLVRAARPEKLEGVDTEGIRSAKEAVAPLGGGALTGRPRRSEPSWSYEVGMKEPD